ncbi:MAG: hypothetical protein APR54_03015 [Candidatus Cloacimonas sp. SDB]|nr:MAG: hypothetical protein APR54_03015 [Candidatus Cloacimonas sp. SDB]
MNYVIFDDQHWWNFFPLTLNRSIGDLRVGILKLRQRINAYLNHEQNNIIIPADLAKLYQERHPDWKVNKLPAGELTLVNSRIKIDADISARIKKLKSGQCLNFGENIIAARIQADETDLSSENLLDLFKNMHKIEFPSNCLWENIWQLISQNADYIRNDFQDFFYEKDNYYEAELGVTILDPYNVWIGDKTELKPGVVIDASQGPVVIDEEVLIMPNAVITGPVFIGKNCIIKSGAKISDGTSLGRGCKIGGELEGTIIQAYSNKQHDGFLGHSYLGEWVNLGAGTSNSDLKNNYQNISAYFYPAQNKVDTDNMFMGAIIGDHVKTAINSSIYTGAVIGIGSNLLGSDPITGFVPSLKWGAGNNLQEYDLNKFLQTAAIVKARRGLKTTEEEKELFSRIREFEQKII